MNGTGSHFETGAQQAVTVKALFDLVAARYDLLNDLQSLGLHRLWKNRLARLARVGPGNRVLDLCCGTGDVALALARTGATVVGLDFSAPMLKVARRRAVRWTKRHPGSSPDSITFVPGDALHLPFPEDTFDAVTISYGLRNLAGVGPGLAEMWRVARPGGRLVVLDFGKPERQWWRRCYFAYLRWLVPVLGRLSGGGTDAYAYIFESLQQYPAQGGVADLMRRLPVTRVTVLNLLGGAMSIHYAEKAHPPGAAG